MLQGICKFEFAKVGVVACRRLGRRHVRGHYARPRQVRFDGHIFIFINLAVINIVHVGRSVENFADENATNVQGRTEGDVRRKRVAPESGTLCQRADRDLIERWPVFNNMAETVPSSDQ